MREPTDVFPFAAIHVVEPQADLHGNRLTETVQPSTMPTNSCPKPRSAEVSRAIRHQAEASKAQVSVRFLENRQSDIIPGAGP